MAKNAEDILDFWFNSIGMEHWFDGDSSLDELMREQFIELYQAAADEKLPTWIKTPESMLALVLLLSEFPRRMFRGTAKAYATDDLALEYARKAIIEHFDDRIDKTYKLIFYLPYLHSESIGDQRLALFYIRERTKEQMWLSMAERNTDIIDQFGRFPERNAILGRQSNAQEEAFLNHAGF